MQRTVLLFILTVTGKFMPKDLLYQNRVPSTMCHKRIQGRYSMLELDEGKLSRPVLRRGVRGNSDSLAGRGTGAGRAGLDAGPEGAATPTRPGPPDPAHAIPGHHQRRRAHTRYSSLSGVMGSSRMRLPVAW